MKYEIEIPNLPEGVRPVKLIITEKNGAVGAADVVIQIDGESITLERIIKALDMALDLFEAYGFHNAAEAIRRKLKGE